MLSILYIIMFVMSSRRQTFLTLKPILLQIQNQSTTSQVNVWLYDTVRRCYSRIQSTISQVKNACLTIPTLPQISRLIISRNRSETVQRNNIAAHIIHTGTMRLSELTAESSGRIQIIAPLPRGTDPLSSTEKALISSLGGLTERLISIG